MPEAVGHYDGRIVLGQHSHRGLLANGVVVMTLDLQSKGCGFEFWSRRIGNRFE